MEIIMRDFLYILLYILLRFFVFCIESPSFIWRNYYLACFLLNHWLVIYMLRMYLPRFSIGLVKQNTSMTSSFLPSVSYSLNFAVFFFLISFWPILYRLSRREWERFLRWVKKLPSPPKFCFLFKVLLSIFYLSSFHLIRSCGQFSSGQNVLRLWIMMSYQRIVWCLLLSWEVIPNFHVLASSSLAL